jgi:hypothetical protein
LDGATGSISLFGSVAIVGSKYLRVKGNPRA